MLACEVKYLGLVTSTALYCFLGHTIFVTFQEAADRFKHVDGYFIGFADSDVVSQSLNKGCSVCIACLM